MEDELVSVDEGAVGVLQPAKLISEEGSSNSGVKLRAIPRPRPSNSLQVNPMAACSLLHSSERGSREGSGLQSIGATQHSLEFYQASSNGFLQLPSRPGCHTQSLSAQKLCIGPLDALVIKHEVHPIAQGYARRVVSVCYRSVLPPRYGGTTLKDYIYRIAPRGNPFGLYTTENKNAL